MKRARHNRGSVVFDKRRKTWNFLTCQDGKRKSKVLGTKTDYPTKSAAWKAAEELRSVPAPASSKAGPTVSTLVEQYRQDRMPTRYSTQVAYDAWLNNHILPRWGSSPLMDVQPRVTELWLRSLPLSPKSLVHIRGGLHALWDYAQWRGDIPTQLNPMKLVRIQGASKRMRKPRSLTVEDFQKFVAHLDAPFDTIALLCGCLGLRISECLALRWSDINWLDGKLAVERGIVRQRVADTKTETSRRKMSIDSVLLTVLKTWKQSTQFGAETDYVFASTVQLGALPWSYPWVWNVVQRAAKKAGLAVFGLHTLRHSYRSWLDAEGTKVAVMQKLMRHADCRTTLNVYGNVVTNEEAEANSRIAQSVLTDRASDRALAK